MVDALVGNSGDSSALVQTGPSGVVRYIESLSEQEQQTIIDAIAKTQADYAKLHTNYAYKINSWGPVPTHDELKQGHFRDFKEDFYKDLVKNYNLGMGGQLSLIGVAARDTPLSLLGAIPDFFGAINLKGEVINHDAILKAWDADRDTGRERINSEANKKHYDHRFSKSSGSQINEAALKNYITKGLKDALSGYITTGDFNKLTNDLAEGYASFEERMLDLMSQQKPAESGATPLDEEALKHYIEESETRIFERLKGERKEPSASVKEKLIKESVKKGGMLNESDLEYISAYGTKPAHSDDLALLTVIYKENIVGMSKDYLREMKDLDPKESGYQEHIDNINEFYMRNVKGILATYAMYGAVSKDIPADKLLETLGNLMVPDIKAEVQGKKEPVHSKSYNPGSKYFDPNLI